MNSSLPFDAKEQVRQAVDIVDLVGSYLPLRRQGRGYVALCPWHDDSRPSLQVNPERQSFKCWVCDIGGDVFSFIMRMEGLEFREALEMLADRAGVELRGGRREEGGGLGDKRLQLQAVAWAEEIFHRFLLESHDANAAREYLQERDISDESIRRFRIGFAPNQWSWLLDRAIADSLPPELLERVGLAKSRDSGQGRYDAFRGRVMFPIRDPQGKTLAFGGRVLPQLADDRAAKYINSPETQLFSKSRELYGLDLARVELARTRRVIVMEGYTDVIAAHQHGLQSAVAVLGTALGERHIPVLRRFADSIALVLDGDDAGRQRANEVLELFLANNLDLRILTLPEKQDPCDFINQHGRNAFDQLLTTAVDALEHKLRNVTNGLAHSPSPHHAAQAVEQLLQTMSHVRPGHGTAVSEMWLRQDQLLARIAREFNASTESLRERLAVLRSERSTGSRARPARIPQTQPIEKLQITPGERELLELVLHDERYLRSITSAIPIDDMPSESCRSLFEACVEIQELGKPVNFDSLMLSTDRDDLKNLLIDLDQERHEKEPANFARSAVIALNTIRQKLEKQQSPFNSGDASDSQSSDEQEVDALKQHFEELKRRQAGSLSTDG